jgi:ribosomal protein S17
MKKKLVISSETLSKKKAVYRSKEAQQSRIDSHTIKNSRIRVDDIVQIQEESKRPFWKLGKVEDLHRGKDGNVKSLTL